MKREHRILALAIGFLGLGILCLSLIGCSSPTAPTETLRLVFAAAPGCAPGVITEPKYPLVAWVQLPGSQDASALYLNGDGTTMRVEFKQIAGVFMVCAVTKGAA